MSEEAEKTPHTKEALRFVGKQHYYAFLKNPDDLAKITAAAEARKLSPANSMHGDAETATEFLQSNPPALVLFVEVGDAQTALSQLTRLADVCDPDTKVVAVGSVDEYTFYCWLMELGISSYILKPLQDDAVQRAWEKAAESLNATNKNKEPAKLLGFIGARGGVGTTTMAISLASMLTEAGKKTAVVDLDPLDGSASLYLDVDPSRGLREALERPDRIDSLFLDRTMQKTPGGLYVLSAEDPLHVQFTYHDSAAEALLRELRSQFEFVVIDMPRSLNPFTRAFAMACESIYMVTDFSLQGLRDSLRLSDYIRDALRVRPPLVLANRIGLAGKQEMAESEFHRGLGLEISYKVPFAPDFFMQVGGLAESMKNKKAPAYKALLSLAEHVNPTQGGTGEKKKSGFLKAKK